MVGKTLNHYKLVRKLGKGGMGEVYLAEDAKLARNVAVKVLPAGMAADPERRRRFEREAKAVAALNHPNIVTLFSVEESDGVHFTTMELVEGRTFRELIPAGGMPLDELLEHAVTLTDAISAAHRQGITHRDLKPDNVMVGDDGRLKVLDFGLAKLREESRAADETTLAAESVTAEGKILGTVSYMSPEQAEAKAVDARSDVFSLGILLYEMATGIRPFRGDTAISTLSSILREEPESITSLRGSLPRHLGRIVRRCLEKDRELRYQSAQDLRNDLMALRKEIASGELQASDIASALRPTGRRQTGLIVGLGVVALIALALAAFSTLGRRAGSGPAATAPLQQMEVIRLTSSGTASEAAISHDGRYVAHRITEDGQQSLWVTQVATGSRVPIVPAAEQGVVLFDPIFSPDGEFVYYIRGQQGAGASALHRVPTLGGDSRRILARVEGRVSFSPDGSSIVFLRRDPDRHRNHLVVADLAGEGERTLATRSFPENFHDPVWSPDGEVIVVPISTVAGGIRGWLAEVPLAGGEERRVSSHRWSFVGEISWLPDGTGLIQTAGEHIFSELQLWEVAYPGGEVHRITNDLNSYRGAGLTADGNTLVTNLEEISSTLWVTGVGPEAKPRQITSGSRRRDGFGVAWQSNGTILYGSATTRGFQAFRVSPDGGSPRQVPTGFELAVVPVATPDGRHIFFVSTRTGSPNLWRVDADGGNPTQMTHGDLDVHPEVSPDGRWLVFWGGDETRTLFRIPTEGGEPQPLLVGATTSEFDISPDGQSIVTRSFHADTGEWRVEVIPAAGGPATRSLDTRIDFGQSSGPVSRLRWSPDGRAITFVQTDGDADNIWSQPLDGGPRRQLTYFDAGTIRWFDWSPDGTELVAARGHTSRDLVLLKNFR